MLKYTICFIQCGNELLLLNRLKSPNMGLWNGIGGKLEPLETPLQSIAREITEETGLHIALDRIVPAGIVRWVSEFEQTGMYVFYCEVPTKEVATPKAVDEGILMWKPLSWVLHKDNAGVVDNIKHFLPSVIERNFNLEHIFSYNDQDELVGYKTERLPMENQTLQNT